MTVATCAIWGTTNYVNSWLWVNILVLVVSLMAIAVAYSLSSFLPASTRSKMRGFVRFEMIQMIISICIIAALLAFSAAACNISTGVSQSVSKTTMDPFQYADYYIGAVSLNTGLNLLSNIYATSVAYSIDATVMRTLPAAYQRYVIQNGNGFPFNIPIIQWILGKSNGLPFLPGLCNGKNFCDWERIPSIDFAQFYTLFSEIYLAVYSPIILIAVGMLFIQFLALPVMQFTAFTVVLPVAIGMRSLSFFGSSLGDASNALIAIAVAFYIIYPMTVAFDSTVIAYVFSPSNPAAQYAGTAFTVNQVTPFSFFQQQGVGPNNGLGLLSNSLISDSFINGYNFYLPLFGLMNSVHYYTNNMAQFIYQAILLFALNITITVGLAVSIYKGLRSGLGEAGRFW
jgi:hypothetical protein